MNLYVLLAFTILAAVSRLLLPGHDLSVAGTVEALEHIWVGCMLAICWESGVEKWERTGRTQLGFVYGFFVNWPSACLWSVTALEVVMFLTRAK